MYLSNDRYQVLKSGADWALADPTAQKGGTRVKED
jgi:hypothetical protein